MMPTTIILAVFTICADAAQNLMRRKNDDPLKYQEQYRNKFQDLERHDDFSSSDSEEQKIDLQISNMSGNLLKNVESSSSASKDEILPLSSVAPDVRKKNILQRRRRYQKRYIKGVRYHKRKGVISSTSSEIPHSEDGPIDSEEDYPMNNSFEEQKYHDYSQYDYQPYDGPQYGDLQYDHQPYVDYSQYLAGQQYHDSEDKHLYHKPSFDYDSRSHESYVSSEYQQQYANSENGSESDYHSYRSSVDGHPESSGNREEVIPMLNLQEFAQINMERPSEDQQRIDLDLSTLSPDANSETGSASEEHKSSSFSDLEEVSSSPELETGFVDAQDALAPLTNQVNALPDHLRLEIFKFKDDVQKFIAFFDGKDLRDAFINAMHFAGLIRSPIRKNIFERRQKKILSTEDSRRADDFVELRQLPAYLSNDDQIEIKNAMRTMLTILRGDCYFMEKSIIPNQFSTSRSRVKSRGSKYHFIDMLLRPADKDACNKLKKDLIKNQDTHTCKLRHQKLEFFKVDGIERHGQKKSGQMKPLPQPKRLDSTGWLSTRLDAHHLWETEFQFQIDFRTRQATYEDVWWNNYSHLIHMGLKKPVVLLTRP